MKILEEGIKGWANVSNFVASVALKCYMFMCGVHTMVAVPAELLVCKEAMFAGAWGASKRWERSFRRGTVKHLCRAFVAFVVVLGTFKFISKAFLAIQVRGVKRPVLSYMRNLSSRALRVMDVWEGLGWWSW